LHPSVAVVVSVGGHRARLFGFDLLLYLVHAGKGPQLATVSSVSCGSPTNGCVWMTTDLKSVAPAELSRAVHPFARRVASVGALCTAPLTVTSTGVGAGVRAVAVWLTVILSAGWTYLVWTPALLALEWLAFWSCVATRAFDPTLFLGRRFGGLHAAETHVVWRADMKTADRHPLLRPLRQRRARSAGSPDPRARYGGRSLGGTAMAIKVATLPVQRHCIPANSSALVSTLPTTANDGKTVLGAKRIFPVRFWKREHSDEPINRC
jgi:hypothetical protein